MPERLTFLPGRWVLSGASQHGRSQGRCRSVASIAGFTQLTGPSSRPSSASAVRKGAARAVGDPTAVWSVISVSTRNYDESWTTGIAGCGKQIKGIAPGMARDDPLQNDLAQGP